MNRCLGKASWLLMASVTSGVVAIATPSQAASFAFSESLLEVVFSQEFIGSETDTVSDTLAIAEDGEVFADAFAEATIFNDDSGSSACLFGLGAPGACGIALSEAEGSNGNNFFGIAESSAEIIGDFFVSAGQNFSFDFIASLLLETAVEQPGSDIAQATGEVAFSIFGGTELESLSLLDTFTLAGALSAPGDSLTQSQTGDGLTFDADTETSFGGQIEFVDAFVEGSFSRTFDADTHLQIVKVKNSTACVTTTASGEDCSQSITEPASVPEPASILALIAPLLGLTSISLKRRIHR